MGVIVMGLCCICLVACALVVLQLRSNNRRISGNRQRSGPTGNVSADRSRDPLDAGAPPSYDAGILMVTHGFLSSFLLSYNKLIFQNAWNVH